MKIMKIIKPKLFFKTFIKQFGKKVSFAQEETLRHLINSKSSNLKEFTNLFSAIGSKLIADNNKISNYDEGLISQIEEYMELNYNYFTINDGLISFNTLALINRGNPHIYTIYQKYFLDNFTISNINDVNDFNEKITKHYEDPSLLGLQTNLFKFYNSLSEINMINHDMFTFLLEQFCNPNKELTYLKDSTASQTKYKLLWTTTLNICNLYRRFKKIHKSYLDNINNLIKVCCNCIRQESLKGEINFSKDIMNKIRLYKSLYYLKLENFPGIELSDPSLNNFLEEFKPFVNMNYENITNVSKLQKNFGEILKEMNIEYELEKKTEFSVVDYFIKPNIVVEVNGPHHYVSFTSNFKAKHVLTRRVLRILGYNIIDIYYKDMFDTKFVKNFVDNELTLIKNKKY